MIRILTHSNCSECPLCDNYLTVKEDGYSVCAALLSDDQVPVQGRKVPHDMSECPFPVTAVNNDMTPGRMLVYSDCSECPACGNRRHAVAIRQSMCRAFITGIKAGKVVSRGKLVDTFMKDCPFPEGRRFRGLYGDTVYGIGITGAGFPPEELPVWIAVTSEGIELARAFTREDLLENLSRLEMFRKK